MMKSHIMMTSFTPNTVLLTCHLETRSDAVQRIEARVGATQNGELAFAYALTGDLNRLRLPPLRPPLRADRLWQHTCFEAFISVKGKAEYYEFNFAPSGEWAVYAFCRYRHGSALEGAELAPSIIVRSGGDRLDLEAIAHLRCLPKIQSAVCLRLALSAVIEDDSGMLSYWALKHPSAKPDFHHPDAFALEIVLSDRGALNDPAYIR
jgi:hypothetical protein